MHIFQLISILLFPLQEGEFVWSPQIQGYILGCYFVGYSIVPIPVGNLIERFGCKWFLCGASFITAVATLLTPVFSKLSAFALMFLQILRGSTQVFVYCNRYFYFYTKYCKCCRTYANIFLLPGLWIRSKNSQLQN